MIRRLTRHWSMKVDGVFTAEHVKAVEQMTTQLRATPSYLKALAEAQEMANQQRQLAQEQQRLQLEQQAQMRGLFQQQAITRRRG